MMLSSTKGLNLAGCTARNTRETILVRPKTIGTVSNLMRCHRVDRGTSACLSLGVLSDFLRAIFDGN